MERDSDTFGLEVTQANDAAARAFIKLGSQNKSDPEPSALIEAWLYTHPPLAERVRYAIEYRPWESGQPNRKFKPKR
jgi:Zn-dependent protease with chaperone function